VLENLVQLKEAGRDPRNRPLLLANIANLTQAKRPATHRSGKAFTLSEAQFGDLQVTGGATTYTVSNTSPHILYLVASEGDTLPLAKFAERKDKPTVSTLFIGTAAEWGELTSDAELENKYGLTDRYEVIKLDPPNFEMRKKFLVDFLSQPDVQALGYNVDVTSFDERKSAEDVSPDEARRMVASYFINTADRLAREGRLSPFDGFMKAANIFRSELQTNSVIRQSRKIDQGTLQTILSKVFPMVLNVHLLPDSDPLKKLQRPDTVFLWQKTGHPGSLTLKKEIIETVLRQLTPGSELPNRNSVLLIGDTGSGKTTLLTSLFGESVLNLRYYNFNASPTENQGAWVFYLSMSKIFDNGGATPANDMMTLDKALEHLDTFLSSANGHRGFIIFDDMHNAPPRVRSAFIQRHRQLLENKTYTTQLTRQGRYGATTTEQVTLPTRNITTFLIMNPTPDQKTVEKYTKGSKPTVEEMAVATLATNDHQAADIAFIKRFGLVRSFDVFPADAKVVQLINESVSVTKSTFDSSKVVNFVNTDAIQQVVNKFPTTDGRTFASAALSRLIKLDLDGGRIVIAVPKIQNIDGGSAKLESMDYAPSEDADVKIQRFVEENIVHLDIENSVRGRIEFLRYMLESTRKRAYETILKALADDERFVVGDNQVMASVTARALADHLDTIPQFPMENLVLEPYQVGADSGTERSAYSNTLQYIRQNQNLKKYPQIGLAPVPDMWSRYSGESSTTVNSRTRQHVLKETVDQLTAILQAFTSDLFRVADVGRLPKPEDWLKQIGEIKTDPLLAKKHGPAFLNQLINYTIEIFNRRLLEVQKESGNAQLTQYDSARMYALALDKALGQLPWGSITMFMVSSLQLASLDSTLGQSVGMQHFMFDSKVSPLMSVDKSFVLSNAKSMPFYETIGGSDASRLGRRFDDSCALWLSSIEDRKLR
jgi:GTPase SAR1 family protein